MSRVMSILFVCVPHSAPNYYSCATHGFLTFFSFSSLLLFGFVLFCFVFFFFSLLFVPQNSMDSIRKGLRKLPPGAVIKVLRKVFAYPAPAARMILNDITRPRNSHKPWIHKVPWNQEWSGCWIGEKVSKLDEIALRRRIAQADIIFFNVHGNLS